MIDLKTSEELEIMSQGGRLLGQIRDRLAAKVAPGISGKEIDQLARTLILAAGATPSFTDEPGYRWATCIDINEGVVHGIPSDYQFREGDIVGIDVGLKYKGFHTDTEVTVGVGTITPERKRFLEAGREALAKAVGAVKTGRRVADVSRSIEETIRGRGYSPVKALAGHGVGRKLHEDPLIPCALIGDYRRSPKIEPGMALAIEVIYTAGSGEVAYGGQLTASGVRKKGYDGWTIVSLDGKIAAAFEETVVVTEAGVRVITRTT